MAKLKRHKPGKMSWYMHPESDTIFTDKPGQPNPDGCMIEIGPAQDDSEKDFKRVYSQSFFEGKPLPMDLRIYIAKCFGSLRLWRCSGCGWEGPESMAFEYEDEPAECPVCG